MSKIKILPPDLINQIAAGEVVERPASVVKELVENALDAQASFIEIWVESGGKDKIIVKDNGLGMTPDDARLAVKRYSTSKIDSLDDLVRIKTFGFRGEALASIASVSKFSLKTKTEGRVEGTQVETGKKLVVKPCAHPVGTTVEISELFYNVPARKKFLKSTQTEFRRIKKFVTAQSIANPEVGFLLTHNDREIFNLPQDQTLKKRIESVLGLSLESYLPIEVDSGYFSLTGFIGLPEEARKKQKIQYIFVNNRCLDNRIITGAIYRGYETILPPGIKPAFIIKLKIREDLIDVNVHPRKEEVKFSSPSMIFNSLKQAVVSALSQAVEKEKISPQEFPATPVFYQEEGSRMKSQQADFFKTGPSFQERQAYFSHFFQDVAEEREEKQSFPILQVADLYLVISQEDGILVFDQHAAEERILFEEFKQKYQAERKNKQALLFKEETKFPNEDLKILKKHLETLRRIGFEIEVGKGVVKILAVPVALVDKKIRSVLREFIDDLKKPEEDLVLKAEEKKLGISCQALQALHYLACRAAVKQGDRLIPEKMRQIIDDLLKLSEKGLTCPHGRPTRIKITKNELDKRFKRK